MIDYEDGSMDIECDECENQDSASVSFQDCVAELKEKGWRFIPPKYRADSWAHFCSWECRQKYFDTGNK